MSRYNSCDASRLNRSKFLSSPPSSSRLQSNALQTERFKNKHKYNPTDSATSHNEHVWISNSSIRDKHVYNSKSESLEEALKQSLNKQFDTHHPGNRHFAYFDNDRDMRKKTKKQAQLAAEHEHRSLEYMVAKERFSHHPTINLRNVEQTVKKVRGKPAPTNNNNINAEALLEYDFRKNKNNPPLTLLTDGGGFSIPALTDQQRKKNRHAYNRAELSTMSKFATHDSL